MLITLQNVSHGYGRGENHVPVTKLQKKTTTLTGQRTYNTVSDQRSIITNT